MSLIGDVQESLAQERKLFAGANTVLLQSILSPIQAGLLMLDAWPAHCDCFAFATVAMNEVRCPTMKCGWGEQGDQGLACNQPFDRFISTPWQRILRLCLGDVSVWPFHAHNCMARHCSRGISARSENICRILTSLE